MKKTIVAIAIATASFNLYANDINDNKIQEPKVNIENKIQEPKVNIENKIEHDIEVNNKNIERITKKVELLDIETKKDKVINNKMDLFKNEPLSIQSIEFQKQAIESINKKYFESNNYPKEEIHNLYVSLISLGLNEAAEYLYLNPNTKIDINEYNENGFTPLMAAALAPLKGGNVEYAEKLIKRGAEVNKGTAKTDITPISIASNVNNYKVLSLLLVNGALFMKADKLDYRPIDYAIKNNSLESSLILKEALSEKIKEVTEKNKNK